MLYAAPELSIIGRASGLVHGSVLSTKARCCLDKPPLPGEICAVFVFYSFICHGVEEW